MTAPTSPCVGACGLDLDTGLCRGCARTAGEIAAWPGMDDAGKRGVLAKIAQRGVGSGCTQRPAPGATASGPRVPRAARAGAPQAVAAPGAGVGTPEARGGVQGPDFGSGRRPHAGQRENRDGVRTD